MIVIIHEMSPCGPIPTSAPPHPRPDDRERLGQLSFRLFFGAVPREALQRVRDGLPEPRWRDNVAAGRCAGAIPGRVTVLADLKVAVDLGAAAGAPRTERVCLSAFNGADDGGPELCASSGERGCALKAVA